MRLVKFVRYRILITYCLQNLNILRHVLKLDCIQLSFVTNWDLTLSKKGFDNALFTFKRRAEWGRYESFLLLLYRNYKAGKSTMQWLHLFPTTLFIISSKKKMWVCNEAWHTKVYFLKHASDTYQLSSCWVVIFCLNH